MQRQRITFQALYQHVNTSSVHTSSLQNRTHSLTLQENSETCFDSEPFSTGLGHTSQNKNKNEITKARPQ